MDVANGLITFFRSIVALFITILFVLVIGICGFVVETILFLLFLPIAVLVLPRNVLKNFWPGTYPETWRIFFRNRESQVMYVGWILIIITNIIMSLKVVISLILLLPVSLFTQRFLYAPGNFLTYEKLSDGILTLVWKWVTSGEDAAEIE